MIDFCLIVVREMFLATALKMKSVISMEKQNIAEQKIGLGEVQAW